VKKRRSPNFLIGLLIGGLLALLFWYWQKSTSAEDGALDVLERLGEARRRIRELESELAKSGAGNPSRTVADATVASDNLEAINGIGPTYARRLREAGVKTFADLSNQAPERLREITGLRDWQAADPADWITEARQLTGFN
jgi:predicted flap endonuclease-1-like 5' DNA nuclease